MKWVLNIVVVVMLLAVSVLFFVNNSGTSRISEQPAPQTIHLEFTLEDLQTLDEILLIAARSNDINSEQAELINKLQEEILKILG